MGASMPPRLVAALIIIICANYLCIANVDDTKLLQNLVERVMPQGDQHKFSDYNVDLDMALFSSKD